jgi:hypothetical protein
MNRYLRSTAIGAVAFMLTVAIHLPLRAQVQAPDQVEEMQKCLKGGALDLPTCQRIVAEQAAASWEVRFFDIKYANLNSLRSALSIFRATINVSDNLHVLSVSAPKEIMPAIVDAIKRLDTPPIQKKSIELTLYVLSASDQPGGATTGAPERPIPQTLQPVVNQLKNVFAYKQFQLVDTLVLTGTDGQKVESNGILPGFAFSAQSGGRSSYQLVAPLSLQMPDQKDPILRIETFRFSLILGGRDQIAINTVVEVQRGQQVVVGKASVGDNALILVLSTKIL